MNHINIFPAPRKITLRRNTLELGQAEWLVLPHPCSRRLRERVRECAGRLSRALNRPVRVAAAAPREGAILLEMRTGVKTFAEQGFTLKLTGAERRLEAGGEAGAFYGCLAFVQLIEQFGAAYSWHLKTNRAVDPAGALSRHFFADPSGIPGRFCVDLGRTLNQLPGLSRHNCSPIHQLLFGRLKGGTLDISGITLEQYDAAEAWLDKLSSDLAHARPACSDRTLVMQELRHAVACSRHAIHRGRHAQFGQGTPDALRSELQALVMGHEDQWLARNRRGGLYESSTRLRRTGEMFEKS